MKIKFNEYLEVLPVLDYRDMNQLQGDAKILSKENYAKLLNTLQDDGQLAPFFLWFNKQDGKYWLVDGHQRKSVFMMERVEPFERPYILIPGENLSDAKMRLLTISSQYGTINKEGYEKFVFDLPKEWLQQTVHFDALSQLFDKSEKESKKVIQFTVKEKEPKNDFQVIVDCANQDDRVKLIEILSKEGYKHESL